MMIMPFVWAVTKHPREEASGGQMRPVPITFHALMMKHVLEAMKMNIIQLVVAKRDIEVYCAPTVTTGTSEMEPLSVESVHLC